MGRRCTTGWSGESLPWAGLRPLAPDGLPVVDALAPRVYVATAYSMLGMTVGLPAGDALADLIQAGSRPPVLEPFRADRRALRLRRLRGRVTGMPTAAGELLAFDLYGTLVDPIGISDALRARLPDDDALAVAQLWRTTQIDYAFRLTIMERYEDFAWVTARALEFALDACGHALSADEQRALMDQYDALAPFPDVLPGLRSLQSRGVEMMVLSNGSERMIRACLQRSGLAPSFSRWMSVDEVRAYKPDPRVYRRAAEVAGRPIGEIRLISSNPFDIAGASAAGMRTAWVDRSARPVDRLGAAPDRVVARITDL